MNGPCTPYVTGADWDYLPELCDASVSPEDALLYSARSSAAVYVLLGRQFPGACTATVRPRRAADACCPSSFAGALYGDGGCGGDAIELHDPVRSITAIKIDGELFTGWHVENGHTLVRGDGKAWPSTQHMGRPDTEEGTFSITYVFGAPTPDDVVLAAAEYAAYLYASDHPAGGKLAYPAGTDSVSRQGQSVSTRRDADRARQAGPSLPNLMSAIAAYNPANQRLPPDAYSPDDAWELVVVTHGPA